MKKNKSCAKLVVASTIFAVPILPEITPHTTTRHKIKTFFKKLKSTKQITQQPRSISLHTQPQHDPTFHLQKRTPSRPRQKLIIQRSHSAPDHQHPFNAFKSDDNGDNDFDPDSFVNSFVKLKVERIIASKSSETINRQTENWDDDFSEDDERVVGGGGLGVGRLEERLKGFIGGKGREDLKKDGVNMKKFAWNVEDLKLLFLEANDIYVGLLSDQKSSIKLIYQTDLDKINVLINFANEDNDEPSNFTKESKENDMRILEELIGISNSTNLLKTTSESSIQLFDDDNFDDGDEDWTLSTTDTKINTSANSVVDNNCGGGFVGIIDDLIVKREFEFKTEHLPNLIEKIGPLKDSLVKYLEQLRVLSRE